MKKYYKSATGELYSYSIEKDEWKLYGLDIVDKLHIFDLSLEHIKPIRYNKYLNEYFNKTQCEWIYQGVKFRNVLDYNNPNVKYKYGEIPYHYDLGYSIMFHQGKVFYARYNPNGERYELYDIKTGKFAKWTDGKNLQPILNTKTNKLI